ncbi:hypothetical protein Mapa_001366 [Marchantia paleacea]|nr:hypothetical protein Mapa_001366 [Marchantia paleacea]
MIKKQIAIRKRILDASLHTINQNQTFKTADNSIRHEYQKINKQIASQILISRRSPQNSNPNERMNTTAVNTKKQPTRANSKVQPTATKQKRSPRSPIITHTFRR